MEAHKSDARILIPVIVPGEKPQAIAEWVDSFLPSLQSESCSLREMENILEAVTPFTLFSIFQDPAASYSLREPDEASLEAAVVSMWELLEETEKDQWLELLDHLRSQFFDVGSSSSPLPPSNSRPDPPSPHLGLKNETNRDYCSKNMEIPDYNATQIRGKKLGEGTRRRVQKASSKGNLLNRLLATKKDSIPKSNNSFKRLIKEEKVDNEVITLSDSGNESDEDELLIRSASDHNSGFSFISSGPFDAKNPSTTKEVMATPVDKQETNPAIFNADIPVDSSSKARPARDFDLSIKGSDILSHQLTRNLLSTSGGQNLPILAASQAYPPRATHPSEALAFSTNGHIMPFEWAGYPFFYGPPYFPIDQTSNTQMSRNPTSNSIFTGNFSSSNLQSGGNSSLLGIFPPMADINSNFVV